jgi:hypothetical protein
MTHLISGLVSWMKRGSDKGFRSDLYTWARTEYKNDWQFAYQFMLDHNGRAPTHSELNGWSRKEVA